MSKVKIQGNASGTGVLTVTAPNTDTDRTITLPDTTGTLLDENSSVPAANLTGTVADARISTLTASKLTGALPAISGASLTGITTGKVLQVIQATSNTATYPTTGWTNIASSQISITPSATSSKILYMYSAGGFVSGTNLNSCGLRIKRSIGGATAQDLRECSRWGYFTNVGHAPINVSMTYLDSPNTTSACSFFMEALEENSGSYEINDSSQTNGAVVIVMEIAG